MSGSFSLKYSSAFVTAMGCASLLAFHPGTAIAQNSGDAWRLPGRPAGRIAAQPLKPKEPPQTSVPGLVPVSLLNPLTHRVPVAVVPAVLMSDGSVFANFGFGFEPVLRVCGGARMGPVIASNGVVLRPAPAHLQPTVSRMTISQLMLSGVPIHRVAVSDMALLSCYAAGGSPLAYVYR